MNLLNRYLEKKEEIIKPALAELEKELQTYNYTINIIDGGTNWDVLDQKIAEFGLIDNYGLIKLLGQIALEATYEEKSKDAVVIGFHEPSSLVVIVNPKDREPFVMGIEDSDNQKIKDHVMKKLMGK